MRYRKKIFFLIVIAIVLFILGGLSLRRYQEKQWLNFKLDDPKLNFVYHRSLKIEPEETNNGETKTLFRATEGKITYPLLINLRQENGLRIIVSLSKQELIDVLLGNSDKSFPARYQDYREESKRKFDHYGKKAAEIYFTYKSLTGERIKQRFIIIIRDDDSAFYFSAQAKEKNFDYLNKKYFDKMIQSIKFE